MIEDILSELSCNKVELAKMLGITASNISNWSSGIQPIPFKQAELISKLTHGKITVKELCPRIEKYEKYLL